MKFAALILAIAPVAAPAATIATPTTIDSVLRDARPGDVITLAPGDYQPLSVHDRHWTPEIRIEAADARLRGIRFDRVSGVMWHGGTFTGDDSTDVGIRVEVGDHLVVDAANFHHYSNVGIVLGRVTDTRLTNNAITDSGSDGIDVAMSQRIVIDHNRCTDFHPRPTAHADCIQLWSKPNMPPVTDVTLSNNVAIGDMQGFTAFNGPYERIVFENNLAQVTAWHGVALFDCTDCVLRHNRAESLPNPRYPAARAWIKTLRGTAIVSCDNRAKDYPNDPGREKCKPGQ